MRLFIWWMRRQLKQEKREEHSLLLSTKGKIYPATWFFLHKMITLLGSSSLFPMENAAFWIWNIWQFALIYIGRLLEIFWTGIGIDESVETSYSSELLQPLEDFFNNFLQYSIIYTINAYLRCWEVRSSEFILKREISVRSLEQKRIDIERKILGLSLYFSKRAKIKL
jgi:hypothetical protein